MQITSTAFAPNAEIPSAHTCEGADRSPALAWTGVPARARSLALIVEDPDAPDPKSPKMIWVHWILFNIPPTTTGLAEGASPPAGTHEGLNDWKQPGWRGPCPPIGRHRYFFKLFALDAALPALRHPTKAMLEEAMQGHVLAKAELVGTYVKK